MTTTTRHSYKLSLKRATKIRRRRRRRRRTHPSHNKNTSSIGSLFKPMKETKCNNHKLSQKLESLKSLIPTHNGETVKPDQLFKETADYIVLLRTRVVVLQKLIDYYDGNNNINNNQQQQEHDAVLL